APLARERNRHLPDFMGMKWLLQIGQLFFRRHHAADVARIDVRIGRAKDDFYGGIELPDPRRGPNTVGSRRHPHVQKYHREGIIRGEPVAYGGDRRLRSLAEERRESRVAP